MRSQFSKFPCEILMGNVSKRRAGRTFGQPLALTPKPPHMQHDPHAQSHAKLLHAKLLPHMAGPTHLALRKTAACKTAPAHGGSYASGSLFYLISSPSSTSSPHRSFPNATTVVSNSYKLLPTQLQPASRFATSYGPVFFLHVTTVVTNCYNRRPTQLHLTSLFATSHGHHVFCYM